MASNMYDKPIMDIEYFNILIVNFRSEFLWFHENNKDNLDILFGNNRV